MKNRRYHWPELLKSFDESGMSQTEFCKQHNINPKYFSLKRSKILNGDASRFGRVDVEKPIASPMNLTIHVGRCKIQCPESMSLESFSALVHQLA